AVPTIGSRAVRDAAFDRGETCGPLADSSDRAPPTSGGFDASSRGTTGSVSASSGVSAFGVADAANEPTIVGSSRSTSISRVGVPVDASSFSFAASGFDASNSAGAVAGRSKKSSASGRSRRFGAAGVGADGVFGAGVRFPGSDSRSKSPNVSAFGGGDDAP